MKRTISILLALAMLIASMAALTACGGADNGGVPVIGENGNWWIDGVDTGVSAQGPTGDTGAAGDNGEDYAPDFRYNTETQNFEISYDKGESWSEIGTSRFEGDVQTGTPYPVENIEKLPGTIADASNKYIIANTNAGGYHGGMIDLAGMDYGFVRLERNENGNQLGYAFLKEAPVTNAEPKYATGYSYCVWDDSKTVTLAIPDDAKYLYIYYNSEGDVHLPSAVSFLETYSDPLKSETETEYVYPLYNIEVLRGYVTGSNVYSASTSRLGAIIELGGTTFNTVTLKKNVAAESITYAFMGDELYDGFTPCYAAGYTNIVTTTDSTVTVRIPDNARYLYVFYKQGSKNFLPAEIKFTKQSYGPTNPNSVRIATWNIGHFAMGEKANSTIEDGRVAMKSADFLDYINNAVGADIMFLNEYSRKFTKNNYYAKNTIFTSYSTVYEGPQLNYSCNAVYSKVSISQPQKHEFECNKTAPFISPYVEAEDYYFVTTDLVINGKTVKLVSVHLAFDDYGSTNVVINQLNELIAYCAQYEHVVLMGDWNVGSFSEFDVLVEAGYTLANTDKSMPTYTSGSSLDNIIYKGVTVTDFSLGGTNLSDHYALYCTITVED